jgi:phosphatidylethanolamine-binding protein (PEBP) family uncharacterized protein
VLLARRISRANIPGIYDRDADRRRLLALVGRHPPPDAIGLPKGEGGGTGLPALKVRNDFSAVRCGGPCLPKGKPHHYQITVFALDVDKLDINKDASPAVVGFNVRGHTLAKVALNGLCRR